MAFLSSRIEQIESKILSAAGARVEFGGLMDIEIGGVSGLEDELVCTNWRRVWSGVESGSSCMTLTNQHSWKGIWWD